jgi:hypothetical protein
MTHHVSYNFLSSARIYIYHIRMIRINTNHHIKMNIISKIVDSIPILTQALSVIASLLFQLAMV